jgi:hypothetical protein
MARPICIGLAGSECHGHALKSAQAGLGDTDERQ